MLTPEDEVIKRIPVTSSQRSAMIDVTPELVRAVRESGVQSGACHVFVPHTTAGLTINEGSDPDLSRDIIDQLDETVPWSASYAHSEGNSAAHIKSTLVGHSATLLVENGRLVLGTWQAVFLCEFDGPRHRTVLVSIVGD